MRKVVVERTTTAPSLADARRLPRRLRVCVDCCEIKIRPTMLA